MFKKKNVFKMIVSMLAGVMFFTVGPPVASAQVTFDDLSKSNDHYDNIMELAEGGIFQGKDGKFKPYKPITRAQVATVFTRALLLQIPNDPSYAAFYYDDVTLNNEHLYSITTVTYYDIFKGKNRKFKPYAPITREQMATVIVNAFSLEGVRTKNYKEVSLKDKRISKTHRKNVQILANHGITTQIDNFRAYESVQRDQFASFLTRAFYAVQEYRH